MCVAPSYDSFVAEAAGHPMDWSKAAGPAFAPRVDSLLAAAAAIAGSCPSFIALDMPIANVAVEGRRRADAEVSAAFGGRGCSAHSPSALRPGRLGANLTADLCGAGYSLITTDPHSQRAPGVLEVYPHPALLRLLGRSYRVPYKVAKSLQYWPGVTVPGRIKSLLAEFRIIDGALMSVFGPTRIPLPEARDVTRLAQLKRYEDALDALVSAWVAIEFVSGNADAYGDDTAAIWIPRSCSVASGRVEHVHQ